MYEYIQITTSMLLGKYVQDFRKYEAQGWKPIRLFRSGVPYENCERYRATIIFKRSLKTERKT